MIDFMAGLKLDLAVITNELNSINFNKIEKKLKVQILKLKVKLRKLKYVIREDCKPSQNTKGNKKSLYKGSNHKSVDKKNMEYYKYKKKNYFKSECRFKPKD